MLSFKFPPLHMCIICCAFFLTATATAETTQPARNVLLLISDDQGLDAGCYGNRDVHTPRIDRLAAEGTRFTHAFAVVASCSPSRATILTGMYTHANGQYGLAHGGHNQRTRPNVQSLPLVLRKNGYKTGVIGKHHVATDDVYPFEAHLGPKDTRNPEALGQHAKDFISSAGGAPFFLVVGFSEPHRLGSNYRETPQENATTAGAQLPKPPDFLQDLPDIRRDYAGYCAAVNNLDRCVGKVLDALDETGATSSTLVIFLSDNGMPFPGAKTTLYDPAVRLPLIVRAPGVGTGGATSKSMVSWVDIAPTVLEWTGVQGRRGQGQGMSIFPVLKRADAPLREQVFGSHTFHEITMYYPMRSVRTRDFKLIWNFAPSLPFPVSADIRKSLSYVAISGHTDGRLLGKPFKEYVQRPEFELYDVSEDKLETRNLAGEKEHAQTLEKLKTELVKMMRETKDPWFGTMTGQSSGDE